MLKTGAFLSLLLLSCILALTSGIFPAFSEFAGQSVQRAGLPLVTLLFKQPNSAVPYVSILCALLFVCVTLLCIIYFFENTQSPEIHFFEIFTLSFIFEALRIVFALKNMYMLPPFFVMAIERFFVFCRFAALFALFAASLFAAGIKTRQEKNLMFPFCLTAVIIAVRIPIDIYSFDTSLCPVFGFAHMFNLIELCTVLLSAAGFFVGAYVRGIKEYLPAGGGILLLAAGRSMLQTADVFIALAVSVLLLASGAYLFCSKMRRIYMWL